jgi:hypothetical protein
VSPKARYTPPAPPAPPAQIKDDEPRKKRRYTPPPPPSALSTAASITIIIPSSNGIPVTSSLLATLARRPAPKQSQILVVRSERLPNVTADLKKYDDIQSITLKEDALVARSALDQAAREADSELLVLISPALTINSDVVENLTRPLNEQPRVVAVTGVIKPSPSLDNYASLRFEQEEVEPLQLIALRRSAWESSSFHGSGGLGSRWLERAEKLGEVVCAEKAVGYGTFDIASSFRDVVRDTFCNFAESPSESLRNGVRDVIKDWESIRRLGFEKPGPIIREAARIRLAESIGRTRFKLFFGTQRTRTSVD